VEQRICCDKKEGIWRLGDKEQAIKETVKTEKFYTAIIKYKNTKELKARKKR